MNVYVILVDDGTYQTLDSVALTLDAAKSYVSRVYGVEELEYHDNGGWWSGEPTTIVGITSVTITLRKTVE